MKRVEGAEAQQLAVLEDYTASVQAALQQDGIAPFEYAGRESFDKLDKIAASVDTLDKKGTL
jgi:hypothetical protein